jgi:peptidoglycan-associated lipoprotein
MRNPLILITMIALSACAGKQVKEDTQAAPPVLAQPATAKPQEIKSQSLTEAQSSGTSEKSVVINPLKDPSNILSKRSIYFDFDKYQIKPEYRALIEAHARYLIEHPQATVTLQGNADDRGSHEYNLSLGQKRAVAVKQMMNVLGVQDRQIETISFGEEKPRAMGHDEDSWAENRRADIAYSGD